jgi:tRNA 2-selenouridine synthase
MVAPIRQISSLQGGGDEYHEIIDVRSPAEFADDHIPAALNLPVLSDNERAEVGTIHKKESPFKARQLGAQIISRNIAAHLDGLMEHSAEWRPLVYCWRGGQRSGAMARILAEIGWVTTVLEGGYKTYRQQVIDSLKSDPEKFSFILLQGPTGSAKTRILEAAGSAGVQVINLEGLAAHRGSLLGDDPSRDQPSQRLFESYLYRDLSCLDPGRPVLVEAESSRIGNCQIPQGFWRRMRDAAQIHIKASLESRIDFLIRDYPHLVADPVWLEDFIDGVKHRHSHDITSSWCEMAKKRDWPALVSDLINRHYDPAYAKSARRKTGADFAVIEAVSLDEKGIKDVAQQIAKHLSSGEK